MIARVRLLVNEPTNEGNYTDALIAAHIERYPCIDERGEKPYTFTAATPPVQYPNESWMPTYDLYAASADIWAQKAAGVAEQFEFASDDQKFARQQIHQQYLKEARFCLSRRRPTTLTQFPKERINEDVLWIVNEPEI